MSTRLINQVSQLPFSERKVRVTNTVLVNGQNALVASLVAALTVKLPAVPANNDCICVSDADANAATNPITIDANGSTIDGAATVVLSANGAVQELLFDGEPGLGGGAWKKIISARAIEERPDVPRIMTLGPVPAPAAGTVTAVTGTPPITSSGGATPAIGISAATTIAAGSLSAADKLKLDGLQSQGPATTPAALDIDWSLSGTYAKTLAAGANAFTFSNDADGKIIIIAVTGAASTLTWPAAVKWTGGTEPTQTASGIDVYTLVRIGETIYGSYVQDLQ